MSGLRAVLFDLDGTVTDSSLIIRTTQHDVIKQFTGIAVPLEDLRKYVGPPLKDSFLDAGIRQDQVLDAVALYRERYDQIMDQTPVFAGLAEVMNALRAAGLGIAVATSKWQHVAKSVCESIGIAHLFDVICGATPDGTRTHKHEVVAHAIHKLEELGFIDDGNRLTEMPLGTLLADRDVRDDLVMIGDRFYDTEGAAVYGVRTILVDWGDGSLAEKEAAWAYARTPQELQEMILALH